MQKKFLLFIGEGVTLAHIVRPLVLAKALDKDIYDIYFASDIRFKKMVENEGFRWIEMSSMTSDEFMKRLSSGEPLYTYDRLKSYVKTDLQLFSNIKPDLIIGDFRVSLDISAQLAKVPYVCLINAYWSPHSTLIMPVPELPLLKFIYPKLGKFIFKCFSPAFLSLHLQGFNKLRKEYGLPLITDIKKMYTAGTWTLYLDLPSLVPVYSLPTNHQYLGPICEMLSVPQPEWWGKWPSNKPVIYLSFGSSGDITLLEIFKDVLKDLDVSVILTTSGRIKAEGFPQNFFVTQYVSGLDVARIAQLFITNGGSGSIYQALYHGVPVLGLPSNMDQFFLMERIEDLGAGILIRPSQASKENLTKAIKNILSGNHYREVSEGLGAQIRQYDTKSHFRKFIANIFEGQHKPSTD